MTLFNYVDSLFYGISETYSNYNIADDIVKKIDEAVDKIDSKLDEKYEDSNANPAQRKYI